MPDTYCPAKKTLLMYRVCEQGPHRHFACRLASVHVMDVQFAGHSQHMDLSAPSPAHPCMPNACLCHAQSPLFWMHAPLMPIVRTVYHHAYCGGCLSHAAARKLHAITFHISSNVHLPLHPHWQIMRFAIAHVHQRVCTSPLMMDKKGIETHCHAYEKERSPPRTTALQSNHRPCTMCVCTTPPTIF